MALLPHIHRDRLNRVIRIGDYVLWAPNVAKVRFIFGTVTGVTRKRVYVKLMQDIQRKDEEGNILPVREYPIRLKSENLLVITQQVLANIEGNVGGSQEFEQSRGE